LQLERQEEFAEKYAELQNIEEISREVDMVESEGEAASPGSKGKVKTSVITENFTEGVGNLSDRKKSSTYVRSPP
jgi:hypothetical protein